MLNGDLPPGRLSLIPMKFVGGVLAIGAGLARGREGPTVHMGPSIAYVLGKSFRRNSHDCMVLMAAGARA
jgi:chloride channel protein, CIC family